MMWKLLMSLGVFSHPYHEVVKPAVYQLNNLQDTNIPDRCYWHTQLLNYSSLVIFYNYCYSFTVSIESIYFKWNSFDDKLMKLNMLLLETTFKAQGSLMTRQFAEALLYTPT